MASGFRRPPAGKEVFERARPEERSALEELHAPSDAALANKEVRAISIVNGRRSIARFIPRLLQQNASAPKKPHIKYRMPVSA